MSDCKYKGTCTSFQKGNSMCTGKPVNRENGCAAYKELETNGGKYNKEVYTALYGWPENNKRKDKI